MDCNIAQSAIRPLKLSEVVIDPARARGKRDIGERVQRYGSAKASQVVLVGVEDGRLGTKDRVGTGPKIVEGVHAVVIGNGGHVNRLTEVVDTVQLDRHMRDPEIVVVHDAVMEDVEINDSGQGARMQPGEIVTRGAG